MPHYAVAFRKVRVIWITLVKFSPNLVTECQFRYSFTSASPQAQPIIARRARETHISRIPAIMRVET